MTYAHAVGHGHCIWHKLQHLHDPARHIAHCGDIAIGRGAWLPRISIIDWGVFLGARARNLGGGMTGLPLLDEDENAFDMLLRL